MAGTATRRHFQLKDGLKVHSRSAFARAYGGAIARGYSTHPASKRAVPKGLLHHGKNQGDQPRRRTRWRRDDPDHLAVHQGQADPPVPRCRTDVFRPRDGIPRQDQRPGHDRRRQRHQEGRRRRQMRHHHPGRGPGEGIRPQGDVEVAERHHPQHPRRRDLPRADHLQERAAPGSRLDQADHHRPPRLWRPVPRHRLQVPGQGHAVDEIRRRGRHRDREGSVQGARLRRRDGDVQSRQLHHRFRPRLAELRPDARLSGLSLDQEHDSQGL